MKVITDYVCVLDMEHGNGLLCVLRAEPYFPGSITLGVLVGFGQWEVLGRDWRLQEREMKAWAACSLPAVVLESQPRLGSCTTSSAHLHSLRCHYFLLLLSQA